MRYAKLKVNQLTTQQVYFDMNDVSDTADLMSLQGLTAGASNTFSTGRTAATVAGNLTAGLKILIGSTTYYIPLATALE